MEIEDLNTSVPRSETAVDKISAGPYLLLMSTICGTIFLRDYEKIETFPGSLVFGTFLRDTFRWTV